jgi:hypothetical protein
MEGADLKSPTLGDIERLLFRGSAVVNELMVDAVASKLAEVRGCVGQTAEIKSEIFRQLKMIEVPPVFRSPEIRTYTAEAYLREEANLIARLSQGGPGTSSMLVHAEVPIFLSKR